MEILSYFLYGDILSYILYGRFSHTFRMGVIHFVWDFCHTFCMGDLSYISYADSVIHFVCEILSYFVCEILSYFLYGEICHNLSCCMGDSLIHFVCGFLSYLGDFFMHFVWEIYPYKCAREFPIENVWEISKMYGRTSHTYNTVQNVPSYGYTHRGTEGVELQYCTRLYRLGAICNLLYTRLV